jgi:predicted transposase YbfD/YdcC
MSDALRGYVDFPHAQAAFRLERHTTNLDGTPRHTEVVYGITSLPGTGTSAAKNLLGLIRGHWTIENRVHWVRDVTFDEDRSRIRKGHGPQVMATLRNLAISLFRLAGADNIAKAGRWCARHLEAVLRLIGLK